MQTHFDLVQLARPEIARADEILRACVHCGFCTATCPTYLLTGDERDSPRGRIWMMRDLLGGGDNSAQINAGDIQYHLDRCLTCLSCMTTCPSGVDYMHLVDIGRAEIDKKISRPFMDKLLRAALAAILPHARRMHFALRAAGFIKPFAKWLPARIGAMLSLTPKRLKKLDRVGADDAIFAPEIVKIKRVILLQGCAQRAIDPEINAATLRILSRCGVEVVVKKAAHCCGGLAHHIGASKAAHEQIRASAAAWAQDINSGLIDAIVINSTGCGTTLKDYSQLLENDEIHAMTGQKISELAMDITEFLEQHIQLETLKPQNISVLYHAACSLQHGQKVINAPQALLRNAGFDICMASEAHLCCGSAGVYNILQPELAEQLKIRKINNINKREADIVVAGNLGCIHQLGEVQAPICHIIQLLDWAYGGPIMEGGEDIVNQP